MSQLLLNTALLALGLGLAYRVVRFWLDSRKLRLGTPASGGIDVKTALLNTLFQVRLFKASKVRWAVHFLLFISFIYLLVVHGLHALVSALLFNDYQPTLDPFQFFRNLTGLLVFAGSLVFIIRRSGAHRANRVVRDRSRGLFSVVLVLAVIQTGFMLEAAKIVSTPVFMDMVDEFSGLEDKDEIDDLKLYWQQTYDAVFDPALPFDPSGDQGGFENGMALSEEYCLYCHAPMRSAFVSRQVSRGLAPAVGLFNYIRLDRILYWLHFTLCLVMLASLPFSRLFHVIMIPFSVGRKPATAGPVMDGQASFPASSLFACTGCGLCSEVCSVYPNFQVTRNPDILPHAKVAAVTDWLSGFAAVDTPGLYSGNQACTRCGQCTAVCPSGIDLQTLWQVLDSRPAMLGVKPVQTLVAEMPLADWRSRQAEDESDPPGMAGRLADRTGAFEHCVQCTVCSNVCPVVALDADENDMMPHQIMNLLRLGQKELATGTRMVWSCLTCYACQENCPQQIRVTDILLELRSQGGTAARRMQQAGSLNPQDPSKAGDS